MITRRLELTQSIIENGFKLDKDLIGIYHIESGTDYKTCATRTYNDLKNTTLPSFKFYGVFEDDDLVGFFGTEDIDHGVHYVNTIFVKPEYRNRAAMKGFYKCLTDIVGNNYVTALYKKNSRAIDFYLNNNGKIMTSEQDYVIIKVGE